LLVWSAPPEGLKAVATTESLKVTEAWSNMFFGSTENSAENNHFGHNNVLKLYLSDDLKLLKLQ
jgi:hypothetical protein